MWPQDKGEPRKIISLCPSELKLHTCAKKNKVGSDLSLLGQQREREGGRIRKTFSSAAINLLLCVDWQGRLKCDLTLTVEYIHFIQINWPLCIQNRNDKIIRFSTLIHSYCALHHAWEWKGIQLTPNLNKFSPSCPSIETEQERLGWPRAGSLANWFAPLLVRKGKKCSYDFRDLQSIAQSRDRWRTAMRELPFCI